MARRSQAVTWPRGSPKTGHRGSLQNRPTILHWDAWVGRWGRLRRPPASDERRPPIICAPRASVCVRRVDGDRAQASDPRGAEKGRLKEDGENVVSCYPCSLVVESNSFRNTNCWGIGPRRYTGKDKVAAKLCGAGAGEGVWAKPGGTKRSNRTNRV